MYYRTIWQALHKPFGQGGFPTIGHTANRNKVFFFFPPFISSAPIPTVVSPILTDLPAYSNDTLHFILEFLLVFTMSRKHDVQISLEKKKEEKESRGNAFFFFFSHFPPPQYYFIDGLAFLAKYIADFALRHSAHCPAPSFRITNHGQRNISCRLITRRFAEFAYRGAPVVSCHSTWIQTK